MPSIYFNNTMKYFNIRNGRTNFFTGNIELSSGYVSKGDFVGTVAHELLHSGDGIIGRASSNTQDWLFKSPSTLNKGERHFKIIQYGNKVTNAYDSIY